MTTYSPNSEGSKAARILIGLCSDGNYASLQEAMTIEPQKSKAWFEQNFGSTGVLVWEKLMSK